MTAMKLLFLGVLTLLLSVPATAADLVLAENGKSNYQIVVPDSAPAPEVGGWLDQTALLVQSAFKANGAELPIVKEGAKDPARPGIYLGGTAFARASGVDVAAFNDWRYVQRVVGQNVIIAGNDRADSYKSEKRGTMCLLGTVKGTTDLMRQYAGVRFLWPGVKMVADAQRSSDGIMTASAVGTEFLKTPRIAVPADLNVFKEPVLLANGDFPRETFYDISTNLFPGLGGPMDGHSYHLAIPAEKYRETHPEYFALINGKRCCNIPSGRSGDNQPKWVQQYCISNPDVQDLIYKRALERLDRGNRMTSVGQPDGFMPCQCEECFNLYQTGKDWDEKLWIFHRKLAERLQQERPGRRIALMCYMNTGKPPKSFKKFPESAVLSMLGDSSEEEMGAWRELDVPGGYIAYLHTWGGYHMASSYTPVRTPSYVEALVRKLVRYKVRIIARDGAIGYCWGLEAPVYYTYGRMFDDPEKNKAADLLDEFCLAAFGKAHPPMKQFYNRLYKQIGVYSDVLGTHCPGWKLARAQENFNFSIIGYLYSPDFLIAAESDLKQAEQLADSDRVKTRISLVRLEFDYVKGLATIVHLYQAFQLRPDQAARDRLLDVIEEWHARIDALYNEKDRMKPLPGWPDMYPFSAHPHANVALGNNTYQNFFKDTCINWDTKSMRQAPFASGPRKMTVKRIAAAPDAAAWDAATAEVCVDMKDGGAPERAGKTTFRALYDKDNLYLRIVADDTSVDHATAKPVGRDGPVDKQECLDISLAPFGDPGRYYHFIVGPQQGSVYDAAHGFITDGIDPRAGKDDITWNGEWQYNCHLDLAKKSGRFYSGCPWIATLTIPFRTVGVAAPVNGTVWKANIGRRYVPVHYKAREIVWSFNPEHRTFTDPKAFGDMVFGE